ncbi:hypothetical protein E6O75_ATG05424 [Venturia nashicola]|uniref:Uncharacterized protein n=1 Tax=Venturia nashicola TaxID=86259 RepID=A0A4Z1PDD0_9PEZI|nr:hypothetical protein E6O75_ATG05424 [Venturia nashicola]
MPALRVNALRRMMSSASGILVEPHPFARRVVGEIAHKHDSMVLVRHFSRTAGLLLAQILSRRQSSAVLLVSHGHDRVTFNRLGSTPTEDETLSSAWEITSIPPEKLEKLVPHREAEGAEELVQQALMMNLAD